MVQLHEQLFAVLGQTVEIERDAASLSFHLAHELPVDLDFKQALLEMKSEAERIETLTEYYRDHYSQSRKDAAGPPAGRRQRPRALICACPAYNALQRPLHESSPYSGRAQEKFFL